MHVNFVDVVVVTSVIVILCPVQHNNAAIYIRGRDSHRSLEVLKFFYFFTAWKVLEKKPGP